MEVRKAVWKNEIGSKLQMAALAVLRDRSGAGEGRRGSAGCSLHAAFIFLEGLPHSGAEEGELFQSRILLAIFAQLYANIKAVWVFFL